MLIEKLIRQNITSKYFKEVLFYDISPLLEDGEVFNAVIERMNEVLFEHLGDGSVLFAGIEARGFIFAAAMAAKRDSGVKMVRKEGKLPPPVVKHEYKTEYSTDVLEATRDNITDIRVLKSPRKVWIVDDVLATGGTALATYTLLQEAGYNVIGISFLLEIESLEGRKLIPNHVITEVCLKV